MEACSGTTSCSTYSTLRWVDVAAVILTHLAMIVITMIMIMIAIIIIIIIIITMVYPL